MWVVLQPQGHSLQVGSTKGLLLAPPTPQTPLLLLLLLLPLLFLLVRLLRLCVRS
jgi:hypothetical protein